MDVSIIVPFRNAEDTLEHCIHALHSQSYIDGRMEILLVDNGATDKSPNIAEQFSSIILLSEEHTSVYAARNRGVDASTGAVLLFTEPDCVVEPGWAARHVRALNQTNASISVGRVAPIKDSRLLSMFNDYEHIRDEWNFNAEYWKQYFGRPKNFAIRRIQFESQGPFEQVLRGADSLLVQKIAREHSCNEVTYCPEAVVKHLRVHGMPSCLKQRFLDSYMMSSLKSSHSAPVSGGERYNLFWKTVRTHRYGAIRTILLFLLLVSGWIVWKAGQWAALLHPATKPRL